MFFGNKSMDAMGFDFSNKEGRDKAYAKLDEMLNDASPQARAAAKVLKKLFGVMDDVPDAFALVHEVKSECLRMSAKLTERTEQLEEIAKNLGGHGQPVHRFGMVDAYLTMAGGALSGAAELLEKLEKYVASQAVEKAAEGKAAAGEGPSGSETPTEEPALAGPPGPAAEAPLG